MLEFDAPPFWLAPIPHGGHVGLPEGQIRAYLPTASFTKPTVLAVALYTAAPGDTGGGNEVSGGRMRACNAIRSMRTDRMRPAA
jgi:hypothetical protein